MATRSRVVFNKRDARQDELRVHAGRKSAVQPGAFGNVAWSDTRGTTRVLHARSTVAGAIRSTAVQRAVDISDRWRAVDRLGGADRYEDGRTRQIDRGGG